jgi:acyl-CoA synthetase (AMP-forming)/AMP-acid ligase II
METRNVFDGRHLPTLLPARLRYWADVQPAKNCHVMLDDEGRVEYELTYRALDRRARSIAAALRSAIPYHSRVAVVVPWGRRFLESYFGCLYASCIPVPLVCPTANNLIQTAHLLEHMVSDARPACALVESDLVPLLSQYGKLYPSLAALQFLDCTAVDDSEAREFVESWLDPEGTAHILYTSGSTSASKGVVLSHLAVAHNLTYTADRWRFDADGSHLTFAAPYHSAGLMVGYLMPLFVGATSYAMRPEAFAAAPLMFLRAIDGLRIRHTACGDSALDRWIAALRGATGSQPNLSGWRTAVIGGEPLNYSTLEEFGRLARQDGFSLNRIVTAYGMTEAAGLITTSIFGSRPRIISADLRELGRGRVSPAHDSTIPARVMVSCGVPSHDVSVVIVNPADGTELPPNQVGELWYASPSLFQGYFGKGVSELETVHTRDGETRTGYFRSGDLAAIVNNEVFVAGRLKEVIHAGDEMVFPADVEPCSEVAHPDLQGAPAIAFEVGEEGDRRLVIAQEVPKMAMNKAQEIEAAIGRSVSNRFGTSATPVVVLVQAGALPKVYTSAKRPRLRCKEEFLAGTLARLTFQTT